jgi:hypothetical protein
MKSRLRILIPLVFMTLGLLSLGWGEREFQRRADRDNAELRQDLKEAEISKAEFAALLSAQTKQQANASSFTELTTFVVLIVTIFSIIPLYSRIGFSGNIDPSDTPLEPGGSDELNPR